MKTGRSLNELATEIHRQKDAKKDYVANSKAMTMYAGEKRVSIGLGEMGAFPVSDLAHSQLAGRIGIPQKYYDIMLAEAPELLAKNVNHWLHVKPEKRMVRTLDGRIRAILSARYRPLDNYDLAEVALTTLQELECTVHSCEITEKHLYLKVVTEKVTAEVKKGDVVQAGMVISNSEVGCGSLRVEPMLYRLACLNGAIVADAGIRKYHVGKNSSEFEGAEEWYSDETRLVSDKAFWLKVRDTVKASLDVVRFRELVDKASGLTQMPMIGNPVEIIDRVGVKYALNEAEKGGVLQHLITGGDLSAYGLLNAITAHSQEVEDYERATDLERVGGGVLQLTRKDWSAILLQNAS